MGKVIVKIGHSTNKEDFWPYWAAIEPTRVYNKLLTDHDEISKARDARAWLTNVLGQASYDPDARWNSSGNRFWFKLEEDRMMFMLRFG